MLHIVVRQEMQLDAQPMPKEHPAVAACRPKPFRSDRSDIWKTARDIYPKAPSAGGLERSFPAVALPVRRPLEQQIVAMREALLPLQRRQHGAEARLRRQRLPIPQIRPAALL